MGFFKRKSSISDDAYKRAYEQESIKQAGIRGKADAAKYGGKSRMQGMLSNAFDNFAANAAKGKKSKSGWGLPTADSIDKGFGSFAPSGGGRRSTHSDYWGGFGEEKRAGPRRHRKVRRVVRRRRPTYSRGGRERVIILR